MRENRGLWRGKSDDPIEWIEGYFAGYFLNELGEKTPRILKSDGELEEVIPETLGECTGLTDKNGKKIFEGDIVKTKKYGKLVGHSNVNDYDVFVVTYESCIFRLINKTRGFNLVDDGYSKFEVIGNIHDNPKLLPDEKFCLLERV